MTLIPALILMPLLSAILILICKKEKIRSLNHLRPLSS